MPCMDFQTCFSVWSRLTPGQQNRMLEQLQERQVRKGTVLHSGSEDCTGLLLIKSGQLRAYILSEEGREITIYRLFDRDLCLFSASCVANYTNEIMSARFSEVMWLMEQIMWKSMDRRVAAFLLEEAAIESTSRLNITHETIANHLGTHREVVTRMLRYFQGEGMVKLSRGVIELLDEQKLTALRDT